MKDGDKLDPDINQQILIELQRLRRFTIGGLITFLLLFAFFVVASVWRFEGDAYADAQRAVRALDYRRAVQLAEKIALDHPQDYYAHEYLGGVYLRAGDLAKAEAAYARSYELYPSSDTKASLDAIRGKSSDLAWEKQDKRADAIQDKLEEQNRRFDLLLDKYEEQARRMDTLLDKREKEKGVE